MAGEELVSLVVPVFNTEAHLDNCLKSLVRQSYENIEVLLVDDGSTDSSRGICDEWAARDKRVKVFHKDNGGLSDARNYGIEKAAGNWIAFVDSDDYLSKNAITCLVAAKDECDADIAICDIVHTDGSTAIFEDGCEVRALSPDEAVCEMLYQKTFLVSAGAKLFKACLFDGLAFPKDMLFEDSAIMYLLFERAKKIAYSNAQVYAYVHHEGSITTRHFDTRDLDIMKICDEIERYYCDSSDKLIKAARSYKLSAMLRIYLNAPSSLFAKEVAECKSWVSNNAIAVAGDSKARLKNRISALLFKINPKLLKRIYRRVDRWS